MRFIFPLLSLIGFSLAASRTSAPSGALVVSKSPTSGQYSSVQDAVDALSTTSTTAQAIFIEAGTYTEQVYIPARKAALTIYGYTTDTSSHSSNVVTITYNLSQASVSTDDLTATVRAWSSNFKMYNINVVNSYGSGSQAVAISASATGQGYYGCQFKGFQDTVMSQTGYQVFGKCLIQGATDFIFGQHAATWFDQCDIRVLTASLGYITASGRASSSDISYYVISNSTVAAAASNTVPAGAYYLGRPWGAYARVVFQETSLSAVINSAGWSIWDTGDERTSNVLFGEYDNTGAGASGTRASFATKLSAPVGVATILGSGYASEAFVDTAYLS
ncbi:carbohydrate esterase family 8 protein [Lepidopterella palustris CBS 459.81]|uniref:Pectinesterase n=1 Tax=Lepidopterella palustris CBS 459.81 TaxID=1314670 RepID=A0A8E2E2M2_9PEZI|nr:carbohydrate esterase family 8 protein [Lepidopterella palustris CBS 459.81]